MTVRDITLDGVSWRVVEKPTHIAIYKTYVRNGYGRRVMTWNSLKRKAPRIGSQIARVLAAVSHV